MKDYISYIRSKVGHRLIFLNVVVGIIKAENRILLQKRTDSQTWGLPGGAVNLSEAFPDALIREVREETGLEVCIDDFLGIYTHPSYITIYTNGDKVRMLVTAFYCSVVKNTNKFDFKETLECKYFSYDLLPKLFSKQTKEIVNDAFLHRKGCFR